MTIGVKPIGLLVVTAVLAAGCATVPPPSNSPAVSSPTPVATGSPNPAVSRACSRADLSVDRGPYVIAGIQVPGFFPGMGRPGWQTDDLALRDVVVVGTVISEEAGFFAEPAYVYTPFAVEVDQVVHGDARVGRMRVAVEGGTVDSGTAGCYTMHVDIAPALEPGARYVLFLTDPVGPEPAPRAVWDAWPIDADSVVSTYQGPMPLADLVDRIDRLSAAGGSPTL